MSDINERLRWEAKECEVPVCAEAADEIDRLRAELYDAQSGELKNALAVGQCCIELQESRKERDRLRAELDALRGQEPAFWYIPAEGEDDEDALLLPMRDGTSPAIGALPLYAAPVATPAPCVTCDELRDNLSDALGGRLHTDDEKARMIDGLLGMIGRISDALGISKEDQSVASGDEEILFAIEELKAAMLSAAQSQKEPHCCVELCTQSGTWICEVHGTQDGPICAAEQAQDGPCPDCGGVGVIVGGGQEADLYPCSCTTTPAPVAQKVSMPTAKGWKCHCCGFDGLDNQQYNRFCAQCRRSR